MKKAFKNYFELLSKWKSKIIIDINFFSFDIHWD